MARIVSNWDIGISQISDFFTVASFLTLGRMCGKGGAIVNALRSELNWGPRWFGLGLSILTVFIAFKLTANTGVESKAAPLGLLRYLIVFK